MRLALSASLIALVAGGTPAPAQDMIALTPAQVAEIFCISRVGNDMAPVEGLLTPDLGIAIDEALYRNGEIADATPGDKPPLGDGIPWQAAPDYAATCSAGEATITGDAAEVAIAYGFPEYPEADFSDTLKLRRIDGANLGAPVWRIDNVGYAGGGDLRTALVEAFAGN